MIDRFTGRHRFLSNFSESVVIYDSVQYPTVEHAYQAAKTLDLEMRKKVLACPSAAHAKRMGKRVTKRPGWDDVKFDIMHELLLQKFAEPKLRQLLLDTGNEALIEGNTWHDNVWGTCTCDRCINAKGQNLLGKLLMRVRSGCTHEDTLDAAGC